MRSHRVLGLVLGTMTGLVSLLSSDVALGHGWVTSPPSRQDHCAKTRTSFDCGSIRWEPQSVEAPKGSMLCSGGGSFRILDEGSRPWPVTNIGSTTAFTWKLTAAHRTATWEYFVDGRLFRTINQNNTHPPYDFSHTLSGLPRGRHTIFVRWNIADTINAFYNCIDVNVVGSLSACSGEGDSATCEESVADEAAAEGEADAGGCSASSGVAGAWVALAALFVRRRRRERATS
jgi:uncharacterized protein (TIGR03382 family)